MDEGKGFDHTFSRHEVMEAVTMKVKNNSYRSHNTEIETVKLQGSAEVSVS